MPFVEDTLTTARNLIGPEIWTYGVPGNEHVLDTFLDMHHRQGLSARRLAVEECSTRPPTKPIRCEPGMSDTFDRPVPGDIIAVDTGTGTAMCRSPICARPILMSCAPSPSCRYRA